jgi:hypothetical protein
MAPNQLHDLWQGCCQAPVVGNEASDHLLSNYITPSSSHNTPLNPTLAAPPA